MKEKLSNMPFHGPLFVVGMPRSGTKLLRTLLNQHPNISILSVESEFLPSWQKSWASFGPLSEWANFEKFYSWTTKLTYFYLYREEVGEQISARVWFESCKGKFDIATVFEALARHDSGTAKTTDVIWGDKSPSYVRSISFLNSIYPDARFIHIVRDVRDYAISLKRGFGKDPLRSAQRWSDDVHEGNAQGKRLGDRYKLVRYEELVATPEITLRSLCKFLEIDFKSDLLRLKKPAEQEFEQQRGVGTGRLDIVSDNTYKWRKEKQTKLVREIEALSFATLEEMGYDVDPKTQPRRLSEYSMAARQFADGYNIIRSNTRFGFFEAVKFYSRAYWTGAPSHLSKTHNHPPK
jgi:hypothetical protein